MGCPLLKTSRQKGCPAVAPFSSTANTMGSISSEQEEQESGAADCHGSQYSPCCVAKLLRAEESHFLITLT